MGLSRHSQQLLRRLFRCQYSHRMESTAAVADTANNSNSSSVRITEALAYKMREDPILKTKVERIMKEFEIYEYFAEFVPNKFGDENWECLTNLGTIKDRIAYWQFLAITQHREELDLQAKRKRVQEGMAIIEQNIKKYEAGGMGYGSMAYSLVHNPMLPYRKSITLRQNSVRYATQMQLSYMPQLLYDFQYLRNLNLRTYNRVCYSASHAIFSNLEDAQPFPCSFINVDLDDNHTKRLFVKNMLNYFYTSEDKRNAAITPSVYRDNPFHNPGETDPTKQVIYITKFASEMLDGPLIHKAYVIPLTFDQEKETIGGVRRGNYRAMYFPIRRYLKWQMGPIYVPWHNATKILRSVINSGGDWRTALVKNIAQHHLMSLEERKKIVGPEKLLRIKERRDVRAPLERTIVEAIGPQPSVFQR